MRTLVLFLLLSFGLNAQTIISPRVLQNNASHTTSLDLTTTSTYIFVVSLSGNGHFVVEAQAVFNGISSSWLELDSGQWTGATRLTLSATGDSIKNVWLPDDSGSLGEAGRIVKAANGWKMILRVRAKSSGNGGTIAVYKYDGNTVTPPVMTYDQWVKKSELGALVGITSAELSDSLDADPRTPDVAAQINDSLNLIPREHITAAEVRTIAHDTAVARSLALGDSLLALRGWARLWVRTEIKDSLNAVVRTEVDPTATAKAQTVVKDSIDAKFPRTGIATLTSIRDSISALVTGGVRGISSTARIFVSDDSITFVGEAGDVINAATGNVFRGTIGANDTLSVTGMVDGQIVSIIITNAGTYTLAWSGVNWAGGTAPTLSAVANKRDVFTLIQAGGIVYGSVVADLR